MYACDNRGTHTHMHRFTIIVFVYERRSSFLLMNVKKNNKLSILQLLNPLCVREFGGYKQLTCVGTLDLSTKTQSTIKIVIQQYLRKTRSSSCDWLQLKLWTQSTIEVVCYTHNGHVIINIFCYLAIAPVLPILNERKKPFLMRRQVIISQHQSYEHH